MESYLDFKARRLAELMPMNVAQLKEIVREEHICLGHVTRKADIRNEIIGHEWYVMNMESDAS